MRKRPEVVEFIEDDFFSPKDVYSLNDEDFMMAISVENHSGGARMDPRYIQLVTTLVI